MILETLLQDHLEVSILSCSLLITSIHLVAFSSKGIDSLFSGILGFFIGILCWHVCGVIFGVSLIQNVQETLLWSIFMSSITFVAPFAYFGFKLSQIKRVFVFLNPQDSKEIWMLGIAIGSVLGSWIGALPIPLDWERWWQKWPITCFIGALLGYLLSILVLLIIQTTVKREDTRDKIRTD